jgi:hypothetical protein
MILLDSSCAKRVMISDVLMVEECQDLRVGSLGKFDILLIWGDGDLELHGWRHLARPRKLVEWSISPKSDRRFAYLSKAQTFSDVV